MILQIFKEKKKESTSVTVAWVEKLEYLFN